MLTRREFLAAGIGAAAITATPSSALAQIPRRHQAVRDAVPPTSPTPVNELLGTPGAPSDNLGGATVNVGSGVGDLNTALGLPTGKTGPTPCLNSDGTHKGNTYVCPAGAVYGPLVLPPTTGTGWTCIRSGGAIPSRGTQVAPANASAMFKVQSTGLPEGTGIGVATAVLVSDGARGFRFIGMEAAHPNDNGQVQLVRVEANRQIFERCYFHGRPNPAVALRRAIRVFQGDFQLWDSYLSDCHEVGSDTQALFINTFGAGRTYERYHVENCFLSGTGENVMCNEKTTTEMVARDLTFKRNHFFKPLSWHRFLENGAANPAWDGVTVTVKNLFEIKYSQRVLVEGNKFENMWLGAQDGTAIVTYGGDATVSVSDVMYRSNLLIRVGNAFNILFGDGGGGGFSPRWPGCQRIAFLNNLVKQCAGRLILLNWSGVDIWVEHNTVIPEDQVGGKGLEIQCGWENGFPRNTVRRNVIGNCQYGLWRGGGRVTSAWLDRTGFSGRDWRENAIYGNAHHSPLTEVDADVGFARYALASNAGVDLTTGILAGNSPLRHGQAGYFGTDTKDIGVDHDGFNAALAGTAPTPVAPTRRP